MRLRATLILLACCAVSPSAHAKKDDDKYVNPERYHCVARSSTEIGETAARRELDGEGKLVSSTASWWPRREYREPGAQISAGWHIAPDDPERFVNGWFNGKIEVGTRKEPLVPRSKKLRMEITTHLEFGPLSWPPRGFASEFRKWNDYAYSTYGAKADWHDLYAMAKGAGQIFIIARDKDGKLLGSDKVELETLSKVESEVIRLSKEVFEMENDYKASCEHEEANNIIVV